MTYRTIAARVMTAGVGLGVAAWFVAPEPISGQGLNRPAAWLLPAVVTREPVARAVDPDPAPFHSTFPTGQPTRPDAFPSPWANVVMQPSSTDPRLPSKPDEPSMVGRAWNSVKSAINGPPAERQSAPNVPSTGTGTVYPPAAFSRPPMAAAGNRNPNAPQFYTAPPAYRWYGWGTTTPGQNAYAPDGRTYPAGSARWFAHTGATPGAFPSAGAPMLTRIAGDGEPPRYAGPAVAIHSGIRAESDPTPRFGPTVTPPPGVAAGPAPVPAPVPASIVPPPRSETVAAPTSTESNAVVPTVPVTSGPPTPEATPRPVSPPSDADPLWQPVNGPNSPAGAQLEPAAGVAGVIPTVAYASSNDPTDPGWLPAKILYPADAQSCTPGALPADSLIELERVVREACRASVTVMELAAPAPGKLTVRYTAPSVAAAEEAVIAITRMPQLKPYAVEFDGKVVGK